MIIGEVGGLSITSLHLFINYVDSGILSLSPLSLLCASIAMEHKNCNIIRLELYLNYQKLCFIATRYVIN